MRDVERVLCDHFRCPEEFVHVTVQENLSERAGFFRFGSDLTCYGRCAAFEPSINTGLALKDALDYILANQRGIDLPFDLAESVSALRYERYLTHRNGNGTGPFHKLVRAGYYAIRPVMPVSVRKHLQRYSLHDWTKQTFPRWPVDTTVESIIEIVMRLNLNAQGTEEVPFIWFWPDGAQTCAVMTHDVETTAGRDFCDCLMDIDDSFGVKASFQVVPEHRYSLPASYLTNIHNRGFEVSIHDLNHDGHLFKNYEEFRRRAASINAYGKILGARGFRAAALYRNIDWFDLLNFEYDTSIPNVGHLDPQRGGCCTVFPYFIGRILEIPVTMTQDYSLFNILCSCSMDLWENQMALILEKHGVMNFIIHPDYILKEREQSIYRSLLSRLSILRKTAGLWIALPQEVNEWWRLRSQMKLVRKTAGWEIIGEGKERARIAYARVHDGSLAYTI